MKKIILATMGLAMFATPLAAENPHSGYPNAERYGTADTIFSPSSQAQTTQQRQAVTPSATSASFGLAQPATRAGFGLSTSGHWPDQDLRDRYGRISR